MWYKLAKQLELSEMNVAQNPVELRPDKESQPKQELFETQKEPRSLFFNEWAQGYKVPEQPVYHGTTREFDQFDLSKGYITNLFGPGFYFTSDENDATVNYTGTGADQERNIYNRTLDLSKASEDDDYYLFNNYGDDPRYQKYFNSDKTTWNIQLLTKKIAEDEVLGENKPRVIPAHIRMKNPLHLTGAEDQEHPEKIFKDDVDGDPKFLEKNTTDTSDFTSYKSIISILNNILSEYYGPEKAYDICEEIIQATSSKYNNDGVSATMMYDVMIPLVKGADNDEDPYSGEIIRRFTYALGHDSIIMDPSELIPFYWKGKKLKHYLTWNPENIKHARQNIEFDPRNPVITANSGKINLWKSF